MSNKKATQIPLQPLDVLFGDTDSEESNIKEIALNELHEFPNHPFKVAESQHMKDLCESIKKYGVLLPGIVRVNNDGEYELISGHCRKYACEQAGLKTMPVVVKELTDDEATVLMVDSNIQREDLLISEKAFAYKMKYNALKRQGIRTDLTSCQVDKKLAARELSNHSEDSERQILRYIHLTLLIPELMEMTDNKQLAFNTAVAISYLKEEEQKILFKYMKTNHLIISMKQANEMKEQSKNKLLEYKDIDAICRNKKRVSRKIKLSDKVINNYFPSSYSDQQIQEVILNLIK